MEQAKVGKFIAKCRKNKNMTQAELAGHYIPTILDIPKTARDIIVICHGFGGDKDNDITKIISKIITDNEIGVVAFDFPIHGESKASIDELTVKNCISDINTIRQFIKMNFPEKDISLFASSFGGYIAINSFLEGNDYYKYVILRSPAVNMKDVLTNCLLKERFEEYQKNGVARMGRNGKLKVPYSFYESLKEHDILNKFDNLKQRMLIFHGADDDTALIEDTERFTELNVNVTRLIEIPNENHKMKIENIEKIINYIIQCIKQKEKDDKSFDER